MKHLNKFNESKVNESDIESIFSELFYGDYEVWDGSRYSKLRTEFKHNGVFSGITNTNFPGYSRIEIVIEMPRMEVPGQNQDIGKAEFGVDKLLEKNQVLNELYLDIDVAIKRVMETYPQIENKVFTNTRGTIYIQFDWEDNPF